MRYAIWILFLASLTACGLFNRGGGGQPSEPCEPEVIVRIERDTVTETVVVRDTVVITQKEFVPLNFGLDTFTVGEDTYFVFAWDTLKVDSLDAIFEAVKTENGDFSVQEFGNK